MRLHDRGVDQHLRRRSACLRENLEQPAPDTLGRPAYETVVERLLRSIDLTRCVRPATARLQYVDDAADDALIIDTLLTPRVSRQMRRDLRELLVC